MDVERRKKEISPSQTILGDIFVVAERVGFEPT